jgi:hypothetical protein
MRSSEIPKLIRCPKCPDAEMALMGDSYILQKGAFVNGKIVPVNDGQFSRALLRIYICGMCGYCEFFFPYVPGTNLIEDPFAQGH